MSLSLIGVNILSKRVTFHLSHLLLIEIDSRGMYAHKFAHFLFDMILKLIYLLCISVVLFQAWWSSPAGTLGDPDHLASYLSKYLSYLSKFYARCQRMTNMRFDPDHALDVEHHLLVLGFLQQRGSEVFLKCKYHRELSPLLYIDITQSWGSNIKVEWCQKIYGQAYIQ